MQKNAQSHVQDSCTALNQAASCLQHALQTVEKDSNRHNIEQSLQSVQSALSQCNSTVQALAQQ